MWVVHRDSRIMARAKWAATASASEALNRWTGNSSLQRRRTALRQVMPRTLPPMLSATTTGECCSVDPATEASS